GLVRLVLQQMQRGELAAAIATVDIARQKFPNNDTLQLLHREIEERRAAGPVVLRPEPTAADLRAIIGAFHENRLTAEQRAQLDRMTFANNVVFAAEDGGAPQGQTVFQSGTI